MNRRIYGVSRWLLLVLVRVLFRFRAQGVGHVPGRGAVLLVANHASFLDPPLVGAALGRPCRFLARSSLGRIPGFGWWMRRVGTTLIDRSTPSAAQVRILLRLLGAGELVVLFPEGTRTRSGELGAFKTGILLLVKKSRATVVPAGIRGSFEALPRGRRFPRLFRRCSVTYGAPMTAEEVLADGGLATLRRRVAELSGQPLAVGKGESARTSDSEGTSVGSTPRGAP